MHRWWGGKNSDKTKRQWKKDKATIHHSCLICDRYHPRCREVHGLLLDEFRSLNTEESAMRGYNGLKEEALRRLLCFEREIERYDRKYKEFDRRMATYREHRTWWL